MSEAVERIADARAAGSVVLDLSNLGLASLPPEIGSLKNLLDLHLSDNHLTSLPSEIGSLTNLRVLNLARNGLESLPPEIGELGNLTTLLLHRNRLTSLPPEIGSLRNLTHLDIGNGKLESLPREIGSLTKLAVLVVESNRLKSLPPEIGSLSSLMRLDLQSNELAKVPADLGRLKRLARLDLNSNQLTELPSRIGALENLSYLDVSYCLLELLPNEVGSLRSLAECNLQNNRLASLPSDIGCLTNLRELDLRDNELTSLPSETGCMVSLTKLNLRGNQLRSLPPDIGYLSNLWSVDIDRNPLERELQAAYVEGTDALLRYLQERAKGEEAWREAKLVLVGEGAVGKTCLLRALMGESWKDDLTTTHGIEPKEMTVALPGSDDSIMLNAWDFGGQPVYRATHQLFFSAPAVYLVVWKPREGLQQDFVEYWIELIKHRVGNDARVIVVATHGGPNERQPDVDLQQLQDKFGKNFVLACHHVDSKPDGAGHYVGISELKNEITRVVSSLPDMANKYPTAWQHVRAAMRQTEAAFLPHEEVIGICADHNMDSQQADLFLALSHRRGRLIYYENDQLLGSIVILKPEWLAKAISFALDDKDIRSNHGLAHFRTLSRLWNDPRRASEDRYSESLHPVFLRLMERFDLSYHVTLEQSRGDGQTSLVAQLVPDQRPDLPDWYEVPSGEQQLTQICRIVSKERRENARAEGLFYMLIVRLHRYSLGRDDFKKSVHWQRGLMLDDSYNGRALLEHVDDDVRITVRAVYPEFFLSQLTREVKFLVDSFWDGLQCDVMVPCVDPCGRDTPGHALFPLQKLIDSKKQGRNEYPCPDGECDHWQNIDLLLRNAPHPAVMPIDPSSAAFGELKDHVVGMRRQLVMHERNEKARLQSLSQNQRKIASRIDTWYAALVQTLMDEAKDGPRLFSFVPVNPKFFENPKWVSQRFRLTLWCEHARLPLPVVASDDKAGLYEIDFTREWVRKFSSGLKFISTTISLVFPLAASAVKFALDDVDYSRIEEELDLGMRAIEFSTKGGKEMADRLPTDASLDVEQSSAILAEGGKRPTQPFLTGGLVWRGTEYPFD